MGRTVSRYEIFGGAMIVKPLLDKWNRSRPLFEIYTGAEVKHLASYFQSQINRRENILVAMSRDGRDKESKFDILQQEQGKFQNDLDYINDNVNQWFAPAADLKDKE